MQEKNEKSAFLGDKERRTRGKETVKFWQNFGVEGVHRESNGLYMGSVLPLIVPYSKFWNFFMCALGIAEFFPSDDLLRCACA